MGAAKKTFTFLVAILTLYAIWPVQHSYAAAQITRFYLLDGVIDVGSYLIAGKEYFPVFESDKAGTTSESNIKFEYSSNNGAWINLPGYAYPIKDDWIHFITLPIDPEITSARIRVSTYFSPIVGSNSYSSMEIGPYKILQPGEPTDLTAAPNDDGTVTLRWNDNSNMESFYQIERKGPDGSKTFVVNNTKDRMGPLSYFDKQTNKEKSTIYVYKLTAVIDKYNVPDDIQPASPYVITKTTAPINEYDKYKNELNTPLAILDSSLQYLEEYQLTVADLGKVAVESVKLGKTKLALKIGQSVTLTAAVTPSGATNREVMWSSTNTRVADVDSTGKITAKSPGSAYITVKTKDGNRTDKCLVTVNAGSDKSYLDPNIVRTDPAAMADLDKLGEILKEKERLESNAGGANGDSIPAVYVYLDKEEINLPIGESETLNAILAPVDATNQRVTWSSDNVQVADVDATGRITAKSSGIAHITVKTEDGGITNVCKVNVIPAAVNFKDIGGNRVEDEIEDAVKIGFVKGYPDATFRPDARVTRAEFTTMLMKGLKQAEVGSPLTFADKDKIGAWAAPSVEQAVQLGIISGYSDNTFRPNASITRAEMISMVMRASGLETDNAKQTGFADDKNIPKWAKPAVSSAEETGIIIVGGLPGNKFVPKALSTRAEAASAIVRMLVIRK